MHSIAEIGTNVPAFLGKLWKMVEDPVTNDLITWGSTGTSFVIKDEIRFARELLPMYYKHNNMASFIRQLNMYGFHKIVSPDAGSMKLESPDEIKFTHPFFMRGHPYLLDNIKRKIGVSKVMPGQLGEKTPQVINKVLTDVRQMKGRQETLDSRLTAMKLENGALWRELSILRQKHLKQQQIVNKLIQFLVTIVQQNHNSFSVKRKYHPRMLQHHNKSSKQKISHPDDDVDVNNSNESGSPTGPVIHELDPAEALLDTVVEEAVAEETSSDVSNYFLDPSNNENINEMVNNVEIPQSVEVLDLNDVSAETIIGMPEDTLINTNLNHQQQPNRVNTNTRTMLHIAQPNKKMKKDVETVQEKLRPRYVKLVTKRHKKNGESQQRLQQKQTMVDTQKEMEKTLEQQLQINQHQIDINKQQIIKSEQQQLQQCQQSKLPRNCQVLPKTKQRQLQKNQAQITVEHQPVQKDVQQQFTKPQRRVEGNTQQGILLQRLQQTQPQPTVLSEPVITIPFDSGPTENIIGVDAVDLGPLYMEDTTENYSLPVVVDIPPLSTSPAQTSSPPTASPQEFILGSPMVMNDPVMTQQSEPATIPIVTSPADSQSGDMQVACVDEPAVNSSNIVSRSAHHHIFMIEPSDKSRSEMDNHIDAVQNDLDNLKELLRSEGISLDANTLLGYFNDDPLSYNMTEPMNGEEPKESSGSELMTCNPPLFDFSDLLGNDWSLPTSPSENLPTGEDSFAEVNTPQFVPQSPLFTTQSKKRKK